MVRCHEEEEEEEEEAAMFELFESTTTLRIPESGHPPSFTPHHPRSEAAASSTLSALSPLRRIRSDGVQNNTYHSRKKSFV